jgi:sulfate adenylyltransferase subunit 1 (EFTu-like GTPase family)
MLLYKTTFQIKTDPGIHDYVQTITKWHGSMKEAGSFRKNSRQRHGYIPNSVQTQKIVVPTNKVDMLKFLNSDFMNKEGT